MAKNRNEIRLLDIAIKVLNREIEKVLKILVDERCLVDLDKFSNLIWTRWYLKNELENLRNGVEE